MYIPGLYHTYTKIPKVVHGGCFPDGSDLNSAILPRRPGRALLKAVTIMTVISLALRLCQASACESESAGLRRPGASTAAAGGPPNPDSDLCRPGLARGRHHETKR